MSQPPDDRVLLDRRRRLRREATPTERALWRALRDRQLGRVKIRHQHPCGAYILDFYVPESHLAIEVDGETHYTTEGQGHDAARTAYLASRGIRVLRFTNHEVTTHLAAVLAVIEAALGKAAPSP